MVVFAEPDSHDANIEAKSDEPIITEIPKNLPHELPIEEVKKVSSTRELLKRAKESANQKLAYSNINYDNKTCPKRQNESSLNVLKESESPAWHGLLTKTLLKRQSTKSNSKSKSISTTNAKTKITIKPTISNCLNCGIGMKYFTCKKCNGDGFYCSCTCSKNSSIEYWKRVCSSCYQDGDENNKNENSMEPIGFQRSIFSYFKEVRREFKDFREIEAMRLQRRLEKLSDIPITLIDNFEELEKKIVHWQSDTSASSCYLCTGPFNLLNRRHHCRLCGRLICGNFLCFKEIPLKLIDGSVKNLKSCTKCHKSLFVFKKPVDMISITSKKIHSLYKTFQHLKKQLLETIPKFNEYLLEELYTARPMHQWRHDAWALRDTLILVSLHLRSTVQELAELAENEALEIPIWRVFANNLKRAGNEFLQKNMFTLQILEGNNSEFKLETGNYSENKSKNPTVVPVLIHNDKTDPDPDINNIKVEIDETTNTSASTSRSFTKKINKLFPSILTEVFNTNIDSHSQNDLIEFYSQNGDLKTFSDSFVDNQIQIFKEQNLLLENELFTLNSNSNECDKINGLLRAIDELKIEMSKLQNWKDKNKNKIN